MKRIFKAEWLLTGCAAFIFAGCASATHTIDPYPGPTQPEHNTSAYQAQDGSINAAKGGDAVANAGAALVDSAAISLSKKDKPVTSELIRGYCEILGDEKTKAPCSLITIILRKLDGTMISEGRTEENGSFVFQVKPGKKYHLEMGTALYTAEFKPDNPIASGSFVRVRLKAKQ
jgi:hypothetical protein